MQGRLGLTGGWSGSSLWVFECDKWIFFFWRRLKEMSYMCVCIEAHVVPEIWSGEDDSFHSLWGHRLEEVLRFPLIWVSTEERSISFQCPAGSQPMLFNPEKMADPHAALTKTTKSYPFSVPKGPNMENPVIIKLLHNTFLELRSKTVSPASLNV